VPLPDLTLINVRLRRRDGTPCLGEGFSMQVENRGERRGQLGRLLGLLLRRNLAVVSGDLPLIGRRSCPSTST